jgi:O-antigen ligase
MTMTLVFSGSAFIQRLTRYALFGATILAIFTTIYNLFDPLAFRVEAISTAMRPAGFYVDSNKTGCALIFGMIFCTGLVQSKYRVYFVSVIGAVILLTFSRGAILSWFIIVIVMSSQQLVPRRQLLYSLLFLVTIIFCLGLAEESLISLSQQAGNQSYNNIAERLQLFSNPSSLSDESSDARFEVARQGWQMFAQHPLFGNGIGSTLELSIGISTHNMYLYYMADHGILGTFIVPALVYAVTRKSQGESKQISISFAVLILLWSLFSHTVIEDRFILIMISLMAAMSVTSQLEHKAQLGHKL